MSFDPDGPYQTYKGGATFVRKCVHCFRFVKANKKIRVNEETGLKKEPNAVCRKCGKTEMIFLGFL